MIRVLLISGALLLMHWSTYGQTRQDSTAIKATALDFIEGWYEGDAERFEKSLHKDLISKVVTSNTQNTSRIENFSAAFLVQLTARGGGKSVPVNQQRKEVKILDIYQNAATVKVLAYDAMEYLHMAMWNGEWKIINILFERSRQ